MIRWQNEANDVKQRFSRTAHNCKVGSIQSFNEAKQRLEDLTTLVRGERLARARAVEGLKWGDLVDRSPLMQRMVKTLNEELAAPLTDPKAFDKNRNQIRHGAELIAAFAYVIGQPTMENADEADYLTHSKNLLNDARAIVDATHIGDHATAEAAFASLQKNCSNCHANWR
jgi:cytochrome c556